MPTQHTPTPWQNIEGEEISHDAVGYHAWAVRPRIISIADIEDGEEPVEVLDTEGMEHGDADFIVRACNAHEDLLKIARALVSFIDTVGVDAFSDASYLHSLAEAAIAKAGGGQ